MSQGQIIKFWRQELRLNQYEVAGATGVPRWRIQLIESGHKPTEEEAKQIASFLERIGKKRRKDAGYDF